MKKIDWSLLRKSVSGALTAPEQHDVESWLASSQANRDYYGRLDRFHNGAALPDVDIKANYKLFMQRAGLTLRRRIFAAYGSIAAASVAVLLVFAVMNQHDLFTTGPAAYGATYNEALRRTSGDAVMQELCSHGELSFIDENGLAHSNTNGPRQPHDVSCSSGRILLLGDGTEVYVNPVEYPQGMPLN